MSNFSSIIIAKVSPFEQGNLDKNGKLPVILNVVAGNSPNRTVLSGTIAEREGFNVGETHLVQVREVAADEYGRQFNFVKLSDNPLKAMDILTASQQVGAATIFDVTGATTEVPAENTPVEIED